MDVLVFRRRMPNKEGNGVLWGDVVEVVPPADGDDTPWANRYFAEHPEMVRGTHAWTTGPYGPAYTCEPRRGPCPSLVDRLDSALALVADCWLVSSIELYDEETDTTRMGPVFTNRVIHPPSLRTRNSARGHAHGPVGTN